MVTQKTLPRQQRQLMNNDFDPITAFGFSKKGLKIMQLDIRPIKSKFDQIKLLLQKQSIGILVLSETWLDNSWSGTELTITGCNAFQKDCDQKGGGVMIYIHNSLLAKRRHDLESEYIEQDRTIKTST